MSDAPQVISGIEAMRGVPAAERCLQVETMLDDDMAVLRIRDRGCGIDPHIWRAAGQAVCGSGAGADHGVYARQEAGDPVRRWGVVACGPCQRAFPAARLWHAAAHDIDHQARSFGHRRHGAEQGFLPRL